MADFPKLTILSDEHIPSPFLPTLGTELSGHVKVKKVCIKRVLNQDCSVKPFTWKISSLYITIELYIYSL
jgi:hypothetical protein